MAKRRLFIHENGYPCAPVDVSKELWFYVERRGIHVITRVGGGCGHIPWSAVRRALDDHKKAPSRRKPTR